MNGVAIAEPSAVPSCSALLREIDGAEAATCPWSARFASFTGGDGEVSDVGAGISVAGD